MRLIVATKNTAKLREIRDILKGVDIPIVCLADLERRLRIVENGRTFLENAIKKTKPVSLAYCEDLVVGEDSGLSVDYLGGRPGVYSKRYSGKNWTYEKNNLKILKELAGVEWKKRKAHFICCLVLMRAGKLVKSIEGRLNGFIAREPQGSNGFGYDPIFYLPSYRKTVAQLPLAVKNKISHRSQAFRKLKQYLCRQRLQMLPA